MSKIAEAMGYIDDDLITASIDYKPRKIRMKWIPYAAVACAACFCILAVRIFGKIPETDAAVSISSGEKSGVTSPVNTQPVLDASVNSNASNVIDESANSVGEGIDENKPGDSSISSEGNPSSKPEDSANSSGEKPDNIKPEDPITSSGEKPPFAYLNTKSVTFSTAKEQVKFVDVKEVSGADFLGYELEYLMPSEKLIALNYVYTDGYVSVIDNSGDWGKIAISPEWDEKIESDGMVFWKSTVTDPPAAIYISESDIAYFGMFKSDADLSKAIDTIKSLI